MNFLIIVISICLFVSLFCLHFISKDDLGLLRKDISMDKLFNLAFIDFAIGLFFARLVYAIFNAPSMFKNPLVFFLFPYFPGLSLIGGILGGLIFFFLYSRIKNIPFARIMDFFSISFLAGLPIGFLGYFLLSGLKNFIILPFVFLYAFLFYIFIKYLYQYLLKGVLREGSVSLIFITFFSLISIVQIIISNFSGFAFIKQPENYLYLLSFLIGLGLFIKNERLVRTRRR